MVDIKDNILYMILDMLMSSGDLPEEGKVIADDSGNTDSFKKVET